MKENEVHKQWKCPECGHVQIEMFYDLDDYQSAHQVVCENCDEWFTVEELGL